MWEEVRWECPLGEAKQQGQRGVDNRSSEPTTQGADDHDEGSLQWRQRRVWTRLHNILSSACLQRSAEGSPATFRVKVPTSGSQTQPIPSLGPQPRVGSGPKSTRVFPVSTLVVNHPVLDRHGASVFPVHSATSVQTHVYP